MNTNIIQPFSISVQRLHSLVNSRLTPAGVFLFQVK